MGNIRRVDQYLYTCGAYTSRTKQWIWPLSLEEENWLDRRKLAPAYAIRSPSKRKFRSSQSRVRNVRRIADHSANVLSVAVLSLHSRDAERKNDENQYNVLSTCTHSGQRTVERITNQNTVSTDRATNQLNESSLPRSRTRFFHELAIRGTIYHPTHPKVLSILAFGYKG